MKRFPLHIALPLAILVELAGLSVTIYGYLALKDSARDADAARFERLVDIQREDITARLESYESVIYGGIGLLNGSMEVSAEEWRRYVTSIPLEKTAPGILGIGTIVPVPAQKRDQIVEELEKSRGDFFEYKTVGGVEPPAEMSYIIDRIEPIERNRTALGLDIGSEANRREAYEKARDTGTPQVTGIIQLVQDDEKTAGFLLIIPRYRLGASTSTVEERRAAFLDAVYAPMIGEDILTLPSSSSSTEITFSVYDEIERPDRLIHSVCELEWKEPALMEKIEVWPYAGREWIIHSWTTPEFVSKANSDEQRGFLYFGITLSTLIAAILIALHRSHARAVRLVQKYHEQADEKTRINELFVEHAPAAIAIFDEQLCFLAASQRWLKQFDLDSDIIGKHYYDVLPEARDIPEWVEAHRRGLEGATLSGDQDRFERRDGKLQYLRWEIHPWKKAGNEIGGIIVFSQDVTEEVLSRKRLEHARRELVIVEERLRQATEAGRVGVWDWLIDQDRLTWNQQMFDLFGVSQTKFNGKVEDFRNAVMEEDRQKVEQALNRSIRDNVEYRVEYRTNRADHPTVLAVGNVHLNQEGQATRMLGVCVDVSNQVRMRTELKLAMESQAIARREAENLARAREQFLAIMSHEIRTPMNGMIGMSELLMGTQLDQEQEEYAKTIVECGQTLLNLVNDILDVSRIEAGAVQMEIKPYSPRELLSKVIQICGIQAREKGLELVEEYDARLPERVVGDENRMQQVLLNLVSNAIKFTTKGSVRCSIRSGRDDKGRGQLVYEVEDTGVGMSEDELEKVFTPFVQADASITRKYGGTGLGLSISRSFAMLMGGALELKSEPGKGTVATVSVPVEAPEAGEMQADDRDASELQVEDGPQIRRLLIAEDNPINQRVTQLQMKPLAKQIDMAGDGAVAVELFKQQRYDLVLMDCQMPVMDGFEAARRIREIEKTKRWNPVPVVALTANVQDQDRIRALEAGMNGFLNKPLQKDELIRELVRLGLLATKPPGQATS